MYVGKDTLPRSSLGIASYRAMPFDTRRLKRIYDWLRQKMVALQCPPQYFAAHALGMSQKMQELRRNESKLLARFAERSVSRFTLFHLAEGWTRPASDYLMAATVGEDGILRGFGTANWVTQLVDTGVPADTAALSFVEFAELVVSSYGYVYSSPTLVDAVFYGKNAGYVSLCEEEGENAGFWGMYSHEGRQFLRDVHQVMFLSRPYLDLQVERTTLEKWIQKKDARGTLRRLTDHITIWTPPPDQIGVIREKLFLSGHLFYHRFFQTWDPDNKWARDFSRPFRPKDVPEIFRSTYRRAIDPPLSS